MIASLHAGLGRILEEGLPAVYERHAAAGRRLHEGLGELGLELFVRDGHRLPELTTVRVPDGVDSAKVRATLLTEYNIEIGAGVGEFVSTVWRIGLMGHNARLERAELVLAALRRVLG
jgi:alanine-glyoxylate transaminase/serine-glyoxylate transaminase/serine-pyruvate transaminase